MHPILGSAKSRNALVVGSADDVLHANKKGTRSRAEAIEPCEGRTQSTQFRRARAARNERGHSRPRLCSGRALSRRHDPEQVATLYERIRETAAAITQECGARIRDGTLDKHALIAHLREASPESAITSSKKSWTSRIRRWKARRFRAKSSPIARVGSPRSSSHWRTATLDRERRSSISAQASARWF